MSRYVKIDVSTLISTDFYIEVPDEATDEEIVILANKEITLPHQYPTYLDNLLKTKFNIKIQGIDSMLKSWISDGLKFLIDGRDYTASKGE